jgi:hypothetical protein
MPFEIHVGPGLGYAKKKIAGVNRLKGFQPSHLDNWMSHGNADINKN